MSGGGGGSDGDHPPPLNRASDRVFVSARGAGKVVASRRRPRPRTACDA